MNLLKFRFFLFLIGCIGSRVLFTIFAAYSSGWVLIMCGVLAVIPVLGWFYLTFLGERNTGFEVLGNLIWWKNLRVIHMLLWGFFAYLALTGNHMAYVVLAVDTTFGLGAFLVHHGSEGNLKTMIQ